MIVTYLNDIGFILATSTLEGTLFDISNCNQATALTDMNPIRVTLVKEPFFKEMGRTMRNHAVALHFTKPEPTVT